MGVLKSLSIKNLAIIENIDISFSSGFTVLTGETGAGKSLVIDSLSLLLGARASSELIRQGEDKAVVKGEFSLTSKQLEASFREKDIPWSEGNIVIERSIGRSRNLIKINGVSVTLSDLESFAPYIADIHNQLDFAKILNPDNYLSIIDGFSRELISSYKKEYQEAYSDYKKKKQEYEEDLEKQRKVNESRDFYEYQLKELSSFSLKENEDKEIEEELSLLRNYDKIYSLEEEAKEIIDGSFLDNYYDLNKILAKLASFQNQYEETHKRLDEVYYEILDRLSDLKKDFDKTDYDPSRLNELEERENDIASLERKYRKSYAELLSYRDELSQLLKNADNYEEEINSKKEEREASFLKAIKKGQELSYIRKKTAKAIEKELTESLSDLLLEARFEIAFEESDLSSDLSLNENGVDKVDFLIETNIGEGLKSLGKVISGGEASRIMLAFKALFIKANKIPTAIFDEIDTGISGESAEAVAKKIKEISLSSQVIAITHMPQVASKAAHHILLSKEVRGERTYSYVKELNLEEKIRQVAYLISGGKITEKQLEYAKEMVLSEND